MKKKQQKFSVFLTRPLPDEGIKMLKRDKRVSFSMSKKDEVMPRKKLLKAIKGKDIVFTLLTDKVDKQFFDAAGPGLKMIANYAVGFDNIDLEEAKKRKIVISNTPAEEVSESVAEHAIALIFAVMRRVVEDDRFTRAGKYHGWGPNLLLGQDIIGKKLGIIGGGRIGAHLAKRMHDGFGVEILYTDLKRNPEFEKKYNAKYRTKIQLLKEADMVSLHVPLLPSTRHLISTKELKAMKKTAIIINTARGAVIDEIALTRALKNKEIFGAGLDVYECEPLIDCNPRDTLELRKLENVVLTPHTASGSIEARQAMSRTAATNILAFIHGKKIPNKVK